MFKLQLIKCFKKMFHNISFFLTFIILESVVSEKDTEKINIGAANPYKIPPPEDLPPGWLSAIDQNGRIYYYHSKKRVSQWLPPDMCKNIFGKWKDDCQISFCFCDSIYVGNKIQINFGIK